MTPRIRLVLLAVLVASTLALSGGPAAAAAVHQDENLVVPVPGMVTMVDLGAKKCIPCKMMAPILEELEAEYEGEAAIIFIDVWENPDVPPKFGLRAIPTQIFYDASGQEVYRHEGFLDKQSIVDKLAELGVEL